MSISDDSTTRLHRILLTSALSGKTPFMERKSVGMVKVDWSKVPKEADWVAMDSDGRWWAYDHVPVADHNNGAWTAGDFCLPIQVDYADIHERWLSWANGTPWYLTLAKRTSAAMTMTKKDLKPLRHIVVTRDGGIYTPFGDRLIQLDKDGSLAGCNEDLTNGGHRCWDIVEVHHVDPYALRAIFRRMRDGGLAAYIGTLTPSWTREEENPEKKALEADIKVTENKLAAMKAELDAMK